MGETRAMRSARPGTVHHSGRRLAVDTRKPTWTAMDMSEVMDRKTLDATECYGSAVTS